MCSAITQAAAKPGIWKPAVAIAFALTSGLFVIHKLPSLGASIHAGRILPLLAGIGYSYVFLRYIDMLRSTWEHRTPPPTPLDIVNYLIPFHMLAAGPIQAWEEYVAQPAIPQPLNFTQSVQAIDWIVRGLFKKFVLADLIQHIFLQSLHDVGWLRLVQMNMQYWWLFLDFSGYSDIALGIGSLIGVATPLNFDRPYFSRNITEFWERWHISLSMWIRRNLFFPIQIGLLRRTDGKHALACASFAIFLAFVLCGIWHGLTLPFLYWGLLHGSALSISNLYRYWLKKKLGAKGVARYMASWPIRVAMTILTLEFTAFTIMVQFSK
jgi:alginate O-acetyltransferase complex protein AlgI